MAERALYVFCGGRSAARSYYGKETDKTKELPEQEICRQFCQKPKGLQKLQVNLTLQAGKIRLVAIREFAATPPMCPCRTPTIFDFCAAEQKFAPRNA